MKLRVARKNKSMIYAEDCFETMSRVTNGDINLILTSPPYNTSKHTYTELSRSNHESRYDVYVDTGSHEDYREWTKKLFSEFDRILQKNGCIIYNINYGTGYDNTADNLIDIIHTITTETNFMVADIVGWKKSSALPNNTSQNKCTRIFELVFVLCRKNEDKNNQELKEFVVERNITTEPILTEVLKDYEYLNECCETETLPPREGTSKSCNVCRWCSYKTMCWIV